MSVNEFGRNEVSEKECKQCKIRKPLSMYSYRPTRKVFEARCKPCRSITQKQYYQTNKLKCLTKTSIYAKNNRSKMNKINARYRNNHPESLIRDTDNRYQRVYGLSLEEYNNMHQLQNGVCLICKEPETTISHWTNETRNLCVDHNHQTGKVRGLLCYRCNIGIGYLRESSKILHNAITYLQEKNNECE